MNKKTKCIEAVTEIKSRLGMNGKFPSRSFDRAEKAEHNDRDAVLDIMNGLYDDAQIDTFRYSFCLADYSKSCLQYYRYALWKFLDQIQKAYDVFEYEDPESYLLERFNLLVFERKEFILLLRNVNPTEPTEIVKFSSAVNVYGVVLEAFRGVIMEMDIRGDE